MRFNQRIGIVVLCVAFIVLSFWLLPEGSGRDALMHPLATLWGSEQQLNAKLLEVAQNDAPFQRLIKPFGSVKLLQTFTTPDDPQQDTPPPSR